jgi:hypothetical protein
MISRESLFITIQEHRKRNLADDPDTASDATSKTVLLAPVANGGLRLARPRVEVSGGLIVCEPDLAPNMWNGPRGKSFFSRFHTLKRCGHMSGLCARHIPSAVAIDVERHALLCSPLTAAGAAHRHRSPDAQRNAYVA